MTIIERWKERGERREERREEVPVGLAGDLGATGALSFNTSSLGRAPPNGSLLGLFVSLISITLTSHGIPSPTPPVSFSTSTSRARILTFGLS